MPKRPGFYVDVDLNAKAVGFDASESFDASTWTSARTCDGTFSQFNASFTADDVRRSVDEFHRRFHTHRPPGPFAKPRCWYCKSEVAIKVVERVKPLRGTRETAYTATCACIYGGPQPRSETVIVDEEELVELRHIGFGYAFAPEGVRGSPR